MTFDEWFNSADAQDSSAQDCSDRGARFIWDAAQHWAREDDRPTVDYKDLLRRYIRHVSEAEGFAFTEVLNDRTRSDVEFTADEVAELKKLDAD